MRERTKKKKKNVQSLHDIRIWTCVLWFQRRVQDIVLLNPNTHSKSLPRGYPDFTERKWRESHFTLIVLDMTNPYSSTHSITYDGKQMTVCRVHSITKQGRILQNSLTHHHSLNTCLLHASLHVRQRGNASIGNDRNGELFADVANGLPVACSHFLLVLLTCTAMYLFVRSKWMSRSKRESLFRWSYSDQLCSLTLEHLAKTKCIFHLGKQTDFHRKGNGNVSIAESLGNLLDSVIVGEKERSIVSLASNSLYCGNEWETSYLRAAQIQVDRIAVLSKIGCSVPNARGIISAELWMKRWL